MVAIRILCDISVLADVNEHGFTYFPCGIFSSWHLQHIAVMLIVTDVTEELEVFVISRWGDRELFESCPLSVAPLLQC